MSDPEPSTHDETVSPRIRDWAVVSPILGFTLLIPPIIGLFATEGTFLSAPVIVLYIFGVWLGLIVLAAFLSRALRREDPERRKAS